ncbi:MAG: FAD-dependent oxidoreductase [Thermotogota bacterium]
MHEGLVLVEAEGFDDLGGWAVDQQFMDVMGSPFLLAHGAGVPVADASTEIRLPGVGEYRVWVRTRDWCGPRDHSPASRRQATEAAPGAFEALVDGKPLDVRFGTDGGDWHWQDGGTVRLPKPWIRLALHDLTGFDGRCDAILLSPDLGFVPPSGNPELSDLRRGLLGVPPCPPSAGDFDLVVVGGGVAGLCAAVSAARGGLKVALVQDRPVLGGNNSSEVRVQLKGDVGLPPYPSLGAVVREIDPQTGDSALPARAYRDDRKLEVVRGEPRIYLFLDTRIVAASESGGFIRHLVGQETRTGERRRFEAPLFADCTGDACVGVLAGAELRVGRESRTETGEPSAPTRADSMTLGLTLLWCAGETDSEQPFPGTPWALPFDDDTCLHATKGAWNWETGMDQDQVLEGEAIRDHMLRAIYGHWSFMKNESKERARYRNYALDWVGYVGGKRESRRLLGDVIVTEQDIVSERRYNDGCVMTSWPIDLHYPQRPPSDGVRSFLSRAEQRHVASFGIPYRSLYSRNVRNLFMAGRDISVTHIAFGAVRVMGTTGMMGEVVGQAAAIAARRGCQPRGVYEHHLPELQEKLCAQVR